MSLASTVITWLGTKTFEEIATPYERALAAGTSNPDNTIDDPSIQLVRDSMFALIDGKSHGEVQSEVYDTAEFAATGRKLSLALWQIKWLDDKRKERIEEILAGG